MNKLNERYDYPPTTILPEFKNQFYSIDVKKARENEEYVVNELASLFHDEWRSSRLIADKKEKKEYEPRVKVCIEENGKEKWLDESKVKPNDKILKKQDIANTDFKDLDPYWQKENLAAATAAIDIVLDSLRPNKPIDTKFIEEASAKVHEKWIERNNWVRHPDYGNPILAQSYDKLPEEEKKKDRDQVKKAIILLLTNFSQ